MLKRMCRVHVCEQSSQQIRSPADLSTPLKRFKLSCLFLQVRWQLWKHLLVPIIFTSGSLPLLLSRRMMRVLWHVVSPGTFVRTFFDRTTKRLALFFFPPFFLFLFP